MSNNNDLKEAINHFKYHSMPTSVNTTAPCTQKDLKKVIDNASKVFDALIKELENSRIK